MHTSLRATARPSGHVSRLCTEFSRGQLDLTSLLLPPSSRSSTSAALGLFAFTPVSVARALLVLFQRFSFFFFFVRIPQCVQPVTVVPVLDELPHLPPKKKTKQCPTSDHTKHCQLDFPKAFNREIQNYLKLIESASVLVVLPNCQRPDVNSRTR